MCHSKLNGFLGETFLALQLVSSTSTVICYPLARESKSWSSFLASLTISSHLQ